MDKLSTANSGFGLRLHLNLAKRKGNVFFSPVSVSVALSMLLRGAKEKTAAEMKQALGFEDVGLNDKEVHLSLGEMLGTFLESPDSYTLAVANAIVSQKDFNVLPEYSSYLEKIYRALIMEVDFATESASAVEKINNFVKESTHGKIVKLFDSLDQSTIIILINAVYFKGTWQQQFNKNRTCNGMFYNNGAENEVKEVPFMQIEQSFYFAEKENYKVLELPYKGDQIAMLIFLPHEKRGLDALANSLKTDFVKTIREQLIKIKVNVTIPKLHVEYSMELKPILQRLGINAVFNHEANLTGFSASSAVQVSEVLHKAVLDVNEEGSEAAAVTAIRMVRCAMVTISVEFKADHPFLFIIYDKRNNFILFMGSVQEL